MTYERVREQDRLLRSLPAGADVRDLCQIGKLTCINYRLLATSPAGDDRAIIVDAEGRVVAGGHGEISHCRAAGADWVELVDREVGPRFARVTGDKLEYSELASGSSIATFSFGSQVALIEPKGLLSIGSVRDRRMVDQKTVGIKPFHPMDANTEAVWVGTGGLLAVTGAGDSFSVLYDSVLKEVGRFDGRVYAHCALQGGIVPTLDERGKVVLRTIDAEGRISDPVRTGIDALALFAPSPDGKRFLIVREGLPRAWSVVRVRTTEDGRLAAVEERLSGRPLGWMAVGR